MTGEREPLWFATMSGLGLKVSMSMATAMRAGAAKAEANLRAKLTELAQLPSDQHQLTILWDEDESDPTAPPTLIMLDPPVADPTRPGWWRQDALTLDPASDPLLEALVHALRQLHRDGFTIDHLGPQLIPQLIPLVDQDAVVVPFPATAPPDPSTLED